MTVLPGIYMVARIDARNFTRLTKEVHKFEAPYDDRVRDMMMKTVSHLMQCGFDARFGYTQSDENSLLFNRDETAFGRKLRKLISILAGEASACFSLLLGAHAVFDCRICQLPSLEHVVDYFRWRMEDAHRNALNSHCFWLLRRQVHSASDATTHLRGVSRAEKHELLFSSGINFNDLPTWQKRGLGCYWESVLRHGENTVTGEVTESEGRRLVVDLELPMGEAYDKLVLSTL